MYEDQRTSRRLKKAIVDAVGAIGDSGFEDRLIQIAGDRTEDPELRARAAAALGVLKSAKAYETLKGIRPARSRSMR